MRVRTFLAPAGGNLMQLMFSSLPMLGVLIYFLYSATIRPSKPIYNIPEDVDDDAEIQRYIDETGSLVPLYQMVHIFLGFFVLWSSLAVYITFFVPKRRRLMESYLNSSEVERVVGDIYYKPTRSRCHMTDYAYAVYAHRRREGCLIQKRVRTYQPYTREKVAILVLKGKPYSGQAQDDIDLDVQSYSGDRDRTNYASCYSITWVIFTLLGSIYIMLQMDKIDDEFEERANIWRVFYGTILIATPILAVGGNLLKWSLHYNWVVNRGETVRDEQLTPTSKEKAFTRLKEEDSEISTCLSDTCVGQELSYDNQEALEKGMKNVPKTHYVSMT
mmetsp:Transcript_8319/g.12763  ORF Transcript_8319/g.12763 Transcript_8319/m.12763 type:complete len:331 (-) Transcript_8319:84-1076(-)